MEILYYCAWKNQIKKVNNMPVKVVHHGLEAIRFIGADGIHVRELANSLAQLVDASNGDLSKAIQYINREVKLAESQQKSGGKRKSKKHSWKITIMAAQKAGQDIRPILKEAKEDLGRTAFWELRSELGIELIPRQIH